jgi:Transcription termination factor nusG
MSFWTCAQLQPQRERLALHCLALAGYTTYRPLLRQHRVSRGRRVEPALFPGYAFVLIELQWHAARWAPGVTRIVLDGAAPARVPDTVIAEIRSRERGGLRAAAAVQTGGSGAGAEWAAGRPRGPIRRHAAAGADRGTAGDPGRRPAGDDGAGRHRGGVSCRRSVAAKGRGVASRCFPGASQRHWRGSRPRVSL